MKKEKASQDFLKLDREFIRIQNIALLGIVFCAFLLYVGIVYLKLPLERFALYNSSDPGYVAPGYIDGPILGVHFFNDYLQMMSYVNQDSPYDSSEEYPNMYGPLSVFLLKPLLLVPPILGVFSLGIVTIIAWYLLIRKNLNFTPRNLCLSAFILLFFFSRPFLLSLDRGNIQGIFLAGCVMWFILVHKNHMFAANAILISLICVKPYAVILLMWYLKERKLREALLITSLCGMITILSLYPLSANNNIFEGFRGLAKGAAIQSGSYVNGLSLSAWILRILDASSLLPTSIGTTSFIRLFQLFCTLLIIGAGMLILGRFKLSIADEFFILFSTMTLATPVSWDYSAIWVSFWIVLKFFGFSGIQSSIVERPLERNLLHVFVLVLMPWPLNWLGGIRVGVGPLAMLLCPLILFVWIKTIKYSKKAYDRN